MIAFRILGGLDLSDDGGSLSTVLAQPKRTALLAYLALAGPFHRRDTLIGLFWPDLDDKRARDALNTAVHYLRRALGADALVSRGREELGIGPLWCDAREFERALDDDLPESALELYRGDLLPGLYLTGAGEFEQWLERERARLRARAIAAAVTLAERSAAAGDALATGSWARWTAARSPGDEAVVRRLMGLLEDVGDRATAITLYEDLAACLREELDLQPSPETEALAAAIRARRPHTDTHHEQPLTLEQRHGSWRPVAAHAERPRTVAPRRWQDALQPRRALAAIGAVTVLAVLIGAGAKLLTNDAAVRNDSAAMSAYREGEEHFQAGRYPLAVRALQRAIEMDSSLAIAYHRLSQATNWTGESRLSAWSAREAIRRGARLPHEQRLRFEAWDAYLFGDAVRADSLYRELVRLAPRDADAWFYLGEVVFHDGPMLGYPVESSRRAWESALALQPRNAGALLHLLRITARERNAAEFDVLAARLQALDPEEAQELEIRALRTFATGSQAERDAFVAMIGPEADGVVHNVTVSVAANTRAMDGALQLAGTMTLAERGWTMRASGHLLRAQILATSGQWARALDELRPTIAIPPARSLEYRTVLLSLPFAPPNETALTDLYDELHALPPHEPPVGPDVESIGTSAIYPPARLYLLGVLSVRLGRDEAARAYADSLRAYDDGTPMDTEFAGHFARVVGAALALRTGSPEGALAALGAPNVEADHNHPDLLSYPKAHERWLRAESHRALGRLEEALAWYATFPDATAHDLMYLRAALERRAEMLRALGREQESAAIAAEAAKILN